MNSILSESLESLQDVFVSWGEARWRAQQALDWIYHKQAGSFAEFSNLSKALREKLVQNYSFYTAPLVTVSGETGDTRKFLWKLEDANLIESVLIPAEGSANSESRNTLCISTQVGCACGCTFCASGKAGFVRNLTAAEIIEQVLGAERWGHSNHPSLPREERFINNIVVMGMGEPLANYDNLLHSLEAINAPWGCNIGARKITVSTSGLAPEIRKLATIPAQYRLAISLHATTDSLRQTLMPINRKYPLAELLRACDEYQRAKGRMISFEYILIGDFNDTVDQCHKLAAIASRYLAHVNLIPYNTVEGCNFHRPSEETIHRFYQELQRCGTSVTLRQKKGDDINAACGQLRLRKIKNSLSSESARTSNR